MVTTTGPTIKGGQNAIQDVKKPSPGAADYLAGEAASFVSNLKPYLPSDLIGGSIPLVPGMEEEAVWNAASQACGTEKIHFCYSADENRLIYLACPSSSLASYPDSWCPLAAALPGNSEYWDKETVYLYEQEGVATAMRWDPETGRMQVFLGASRTILPRVQSMDANFVTINPDVADIVPWINRNLKTEKLSRATAKTLALLGAFAAIIGMGFLLFNYFALNLIERDLETLRKQSQEASVELIRSAADVMKSDTAQSMIQIQDILARLSEVDGTLVKYEVNNGKITWQALVPPAFAQDFGTPMGLEKDGRARVNGR